MFYMVEAQQDANDRARFMRIPLQCCWFLEAAQFSLRRKLDWVRSYKFKELVRIIEELLEWKNSGSGLENRN
jgi:hypothetical protein